MLISKFMYIRDCKIKEAYRLGFLGIISRAEVSSTNFVWIQIKNGPLFAKERAKIPYF
jgi:hypothetical protein